jgi:ABC-type multidrug transport system fused ATPase/permease subunit
VQPSSDSTTHGQPSIIKIKSLLIRIFWTMIHLSIAVFFFIFIIITLMKYLEFRVTTTTRTRSEEFKMKLPMIIFCNSKTFLTKAAHDLTIKEFLDLYGSSAPSNVTEVLYGNSTNPKDVKAFVNDF